MKIIPVFMLALTLSAADNLLRNPGFEQGGAGWMASGIASRYSIARDAGRNGSAALRYEKRSEGEPNENSIYAQEVDVQPNAVYAAAIWTKAEGNLRPVLRIASMDWDTIAIAAAGPSREWQQIQTRFDSGSNRRIRFQIYGGSLGQIRQSAPGVSYFDEAVLGKATAAEAAALRAVRISVHPEKTLREIDPLFFGSNILFMIDDNAALADGKIARSLRQIPIRLIRYPGGDVADNYHWKTGTLDDMHHFPNRAGPETTDTDEFMTFCRQAGAEPIFVTDLESGFVHHDIDAAAREAADWVAHCNKQKNYHVKYWEIGNETYIYNPATHHKRAPVTARQYGEAFVKFSRAMKAVDPTIKTGAVGPQDATRKVSLEQLPDGSRKRDEDAWWPAVTKIAGSQMDFMIVHEYYRAPLNAPVERAGEIAGLRDFLHATFPGRYVPIALTEWNLNKEMKVSDAERAVLLAQYIAEYIKGGVDMATFWPLRYNSAEWGTRAMLSQDREPQTAYYVMKLFSSNTAEKLLESGCSSPNVAVFTTGDRAGKRIAMFLINRSSEAQHPEISLGPFRAARATAQSLTAKTLASPDHALDNAAMKGRAGTWSCELPPQSITLVLFDAE